jgi:flagellar hook-associated protein 3 FlgL
MRIGTLQMFRQGIGSILDQQTELFRAQEQLSSGKRIVNPSDDPIGSAQLVGLSETFAVTEQYQRNIQQLQTRLELEDTALASIGDALQRARVLAVQGLNDTNGADERAAMANEISQILDEVVGLANRKAENGEYLFAGFQGQTAPFSHDGAGNFTYAGDQGQRRLQVGPARQIADGDSGQAVFLDIPSIAGGTESVFATLYALASDLASNAPDPDSLEQIDNAMNHLLGYRATVGARLNAADSQQDINEALLLQLEQSRSNIEDLDYAEAASRLSQASVTLQAAQQAFVRVQNLNLFNFL